MSNRSPLRWLAAAVGIAAGVYAAHAAVAWLRYGRAARPEPEEQDALLDRFLPEYEVAERHRIRVKAPAAITLGAAKDMELLRMPVVRALVRARERILGGNPDERPRPAGLVAETLALGWGLLAEEPGREIVVGAVTRPWEANVTFRALPPGDFAAFREPDYTKIVWTLRADADGEGESVFRTETRVATTDGEARAKFRRYWALLSPGIILIRWLSLRPLKAEAERRAGI